MGTCPKCKQRIRKNGVFEDVALAAILKSDWKDRDNVAQEEAPTMADAEAADFRTAKGVHADAARCRRQRGRAHHRGR